MAVALVAAPLLAKEEYRIAVNEGGIEVATSCEEGPRPRCTISAVRSAITVEIANRKRNVGGPVVVLRRTGRGGEPAGCRVNR